MLKLEKLNKKFPDFEIRDISFEVNKGEYFVLLGPSGAGKSVILEIVAGLEKHDSGKVFFEGENYSDEKIQNRPFGLVYQDYALFPHLSVYQNIVYPVRKLKWTKEKIQKELRSLTSFFNIEELLHRKPETLSGGEKQRVALARTLIRKPKLLLLDEPLSALDVKLKRETRRFLRALKNENMTVLHITHSFKEAISLADRVAVINKGELIQSGTPTEVFNFPRNEFIAEFTGVKNFFHVEFKKGNIAVINRNISILHTSEMCCETGFIVIPEDSVFFSKEKIESSAQNNFSGTLKDFYPVSGHHELIIDCGVILSAKISNDSFKKLNLENDQNLWLSFKAASVKVIPKE